MLLFAAGTDAEWYEEELRTLGLPTYRGTGRRYFGQQQVVDLLRYLRLLRNRYDDEALVAVLASPFVGVSNDALVLIRRHTGRRPLYTGIERSLPPALDVRDEQLVRAFKQRYERLVAASARVSLERLCEQIVSEHDYDLAVLARRDGQRRYANLRKLMRLARSYEELRGRDIEGFVRFINEQEALGAAQLEAVSEEEGADAVRLLTIHAAKGLEFKVVVVADAGRDTGGPPAADEILALSDGRFGFKVVHPATGVSHGVFAYDEVREAGMEADRHERLPPLLRRDDARDRPADRVGRDRRPARHADRVGALAARVRRGARSGGVAVRARARPGDVPRAGRPAERARRRSRRSPWSRPRRGSCRSSPSCRRRPAPRRLPAAGARARPLAADPPRAPPLVLGARALRALLVPLLRRACRRPARAARRSARRGRPGRDRDRRRRAPPARDGRSRRPEDAGPRTSCARGIRP